MYKNNLEKIGLTNDIKKVLYTNFLVYNRYYFYYNENKAAIIYLLLPENTFITKEDLSRNNMIKTVYNGVISTIITNFKTISLSTEDKIRTIIKFSNYLCLPNEFSDGFKTVLPECADDELKTKFLIKCNNMDMRTIFCIRNESLKLRINNFNFRGNSTDIRYFLENLFDVKSFTINEYLNIAKKFDDLLSSWINDVNAECRNIMPPILGDASNDLDIIKEIIDFFSKDIVLKDGRNIKGYFTKARWYPIFNIFEMYYRKILKTNGNYSLNYLSETINDYKDGQIGFIDIYNKIRSLFISELLNPILKKIEEGDINYLDTILETRKTHFVRFEDLRNDKKSCNEYYVYEEILNYIKYFYVDKDIKSEIYYKIYKSYNDIIKNFSRRNKSIDLFRNHSFYMYELNLKDFTKLVIEDFGYKEYLKKYSKDWFKKFVKDINDIPNNIMEILNYLMSLDVSKIDINSIETIENLMSFRNLLIRWYEFLYKDINNGVNLSDTYQMKIENLYKTYKLLQIIYPDNEVNHVLTSSNIRYDFTSKNLSFIIQILRNKKDIICKSPLLDCSIDTNYYKSYDNNSINYKLKQVEKVKNPKVILVRKINSVCIPICIEYKYATFSTREGFMLVLDNLTDYSLLGNYNDFCTEISKKLERILTTYVIREPQIKLDNLENDLNDLKRFIIMPNDDNDSKSYIESENQISLYYINEV